MKNLVKAKPVFDLEKALAAHRANKHILKHAKLQFIGVSGYDVYNISQSFIWDGITYLAGRVEKRNSEISSVRIFERIAQHSYKVTKHEIPMLQDPSVQIMDGQLLIGGTEIYPNEQGQITSWRTVFYQGKDFMHLTKVLSAPLKMKDVRVIHGDQYYVMSRPQGGVAKYGKIGLASANKLADITPELIEKAPLLDDLFTDQVWGGANQIHVLKNGWLGVLGHVAIMSEGDVRHYYGMTFAVNPVTHERTDLKIICERNDFAPGESKRPDLVDVVFVGGLNRHDDGNATLYTGLSDAEAHVMLIEDPFLEYETK